VVAADLRVEEADGKAVLVEERAGASNLAEDHLEVVDTLAALLEGHRARVVNEDDSVEERDLDEVDGELGGETPLRRELLEGTSLDNAVRDALHVGRVAVERLDVLLLDALVEDLHNVLGRDVAAANSSTSARRATVLLLLLGLAVLAGLLLPVLTLLGLTVLAGLLAGLAVSTLLAILTCLLAVLLLLAVLALLLAIGTSGTGLLAVRARSAGSTGLAGAGTGDGRRAVLAGLLLAGLAVSTLLAILTRLLAVLALLLLAVRAGGGTALGRAVLALLLGSTVLALLLRGLAVGTGGAGLALAMANRGGERRPTAPAAGAAPPWNCWPAWLACAEG
jgi:hypothetical protein